MKSTTHSSHNRPLFLKLGKESNKGSCPRLPVLGKKSSLTEQSEKKNFDHQIQLNTPSVLEELVVKQLSFWEQENLNYKSERFDFLFHYLSRYYKENNIKEKLKELDALAKIKKTSENINRAFHNQIIKPKLNKALDDVFIENKQKEGTILLNSIAKTSARFNYLLTGSKTQRQIQSDLQIDFSSINTLKKIKSGLLYENENEEAKNESNNYYRKIISEKEHEESTMRDDLIKMAMLVKNKKIEKDEIKSKIDILYSNKAEKDEIFSKEKLLLQNLKKKNSTLFYKKKSLVKGKSINDDAMFVQQLKSTANNNEIESKIQLITIENDKINTEYTKEKNELLKGLDLASKEEELLKFIYHFIIKEQRSYYYKILKKGYDVRDDGLVWVVRRLLELNSNIDYHHFPKFLDNQQIEYLIIQAKLHFEESILLMLFQGSKNRQAKYRNLNKSRFVTLNETALKKKLLYITNKKEGSSNIKIKLSNTFDSIREKYKNAFNLPETSSQGEEVNLQVCISNIKNDLLKGNCESSSVNKENNLENFFKDNDEKKMEFELIMRMRENIQKIKEQIEKNKKKMIEEFKSKIDKDQLTVNAKLSLQTDLVFSALFGSNFSL